MQRIVIVFIAAAFSAGIHCGCGTFVQGRAASAEAEALVKQIRTNCDLDRANRPDFEDPYNVGMPKLIRVGEKAIPAIRAALKPGEPRIFLVILTESLVKIGGDATVPALADVIALGNANLSDSALWALKATGTRRALDVVEKVLTGDNQEEVRYMAVRVLDESFGGKDILPTLRTLLHDPSARIRKEATATIDLIRNALNLSPEETLSSTNSPPSKP